MAVLNKTLNKIVNFSIPIYENRVCDTDRFAPEHQYHHTVAELCMVWKPGFTDLEVLPRKSDALIAGSTNRTC